MLVKFIGKLFVLQSESFLVGFVFLEFHFNEIIILLSSSEFIFDLLIVFLMTSDNFIIVSFLSLGFGFKLLLKIEF